MEDHYTTLPVRLFMRPNLIRATHNVHNRDTDSIWVQVLARLGCILEGSRACSPTASFLAFSPFAPALFVASGTAATAGMMAIAPGRGGCAALNTAATAGAATGAGSSRMMSFIRLRCKLSL